MVLFSSKFLLLIVSCRWILSSEVGNMAVNLRQELDSFLNRQASPCQHVHSEEKHRFRGKYPWAYRSTYSKRVFCPVLSTQNLSLDWPGICGIRIDLVESTLTVDWGPHMPLLLRSMNIRTQNIYTNYLRNKIWVIRITPSFLLAVSTCNRYALGTQSSKQSHLEPRWGWLNAYLCPNYILACQSMAAS